MNTTITGTFIVPLAHPKDQRPPVGAACSGYTTQLACYTGKVVGHFDRGFYLQGTKRI